MADVVPFGKYRGQPVEAMLQDASYLEWLIGQSWFKGRYAALHTLIINYSGEAAETPAHNRLQCLFLDEGFRRRLVELVEPQWIGSMVGAVQYTDEVRFEHDNVDVAIIADVELPSFRDKDDGYEHGGWKRGLIAVEIKPTLGDDFPSAIRQINRYRSRKVSVYEIDPWRNWPLFTWVLLTEQYTGTGATEDQVRQVLKASGIRLVFVRDIDGVR